MDALAMERRHLAQVYGQLDLVPERGDGVYLHCRGRRVLDLYGGHAVAALGYGHPELLAALNRQAAELLFQSNAVPLPVRARAADALAEFAPPGLARVFFVNTGAEANENALRLACRLTGRQRVAAIEHGFHGRSAAAGAVTWGARDRWYAFPRTPFDVDFIPRDDVAAVEQLVTGDTAAVILELVQGIAGAVELQPAFVQAVARACERHGALLIVDEVQTGMGRCGAPFATDLYGLQPDILSTAKSLAAGFPCGAVLMTEAVASGLGKGDLGTTFGGGPLACALVETVIRVIRRDGLIDNVNRLHARLAAALPLGPAASLQGRGFLAGLRLTRPAADVQRELLARDILVGSSSDPMVLRLLPPLILADAQLDELLEALADLPAGV